MAELGKLLEGLGFENVSTYIASGNVFLASDLSAAQVAETIEQRCRRPSSSTPTSSRSPS